MKKNEGAISSAEEIEKRSAVGVFGYPAGKSIIIDKIAPLVTPHRVYTEVFCGSAAVFFGKEQRAEVEALNDLNGDVAHVYKTMRDMSDTEFDQLSKMNWTASEELFKKLKKVQPTDKLEKMHRFLYVLRFSHGRMGAFGSSGGYDHFSDGHTCLIPKRIAKFRERLQGVQIRNADYADVLKEFDSKDAFHFLDPPYVGYDVTIGEKTFDETRFRKVLEGLKGRFLLTYGAKGGLDTSGFHMKKLNQRRSIRNRNGESGSKILTHLLVSNYEIKKKSLGEFSLEEVEGVVEESGGKTSVFLSAGASVEKEVLVNKTKSVPIDACFGIGISKGQLVATLGGPRLDLVFGIGREGAPAHRLETIAKSFSVNGNRHVAPLATGVPLTSAHEATEKMTEWAALQRPKVEHGLQTQSAREYFLSKGDGVPHLLGRMMVVKTASGEVGSIDPLDILPSVLRKGSPMPPEGVSALPSGIEKAVPAQFRYWLAKGEEASVIRDALIASGELGQDNVALVNGEFARVTRKVFLYEPAQSISKNDVGQWEIAKITEQLPEGTRLRELFGPIQKVGEGEVLYYDACTIDPKDSPAFEGIVARALKIDSEFVITSVDAPHARAALSKIGRPFKFTPSTDVPPEAVHRVFVASFPISKSAGLEWADVAKDDMGLGDMSNAGMIQPSQGQQEDPVACFLAMKASGMTDEEAKRACGATTKADAWTMPIMNSIPVFKAADADERYVLGIVLEPEVVDAQNDIYSHDEVRQAAHKFMEQFRNIGFMHKQIINSKAKILESYLAPVDFEVGGQKVKKGTWVLAEKVLDDQLWNAIKKQEITGFSIGGSAQRTPTGKSDDTKKKVDFQGLEIHIDRPKGFVQRGEGPSGPWERTYKVDYGEIPGTLGGDGEGLDVFVGPDNKSSDVFWMIQKKHSGEFDEYKLIVGTRDEKAARAIYTDHIPKDLLGGVAKTSIEMVKALRGIEPIERLKRIQSEVAKALIESVS